MLLEVGSVSIRNTKNILFKNAFDVCISACCFYLWGYAFAYGDDSSGGFVEPRNSRCQTWRKGGARGEFVRRVDIARPFASGRGVFLRALCVCVEFCRDGGDDYEWSCRGEDEL